MLATYQPNAVGRFGEADEVAEVAAFVAEMEGSYLLGQILFVDGGTEALIRPVAV